MRKQLFILYFLLSASVGFAREIKWADQYVFTLKKVTDVMLNDVASPVAASRYYAYITLSAYETANLFDGQSARSMQGMVNQFPGLRIHPDMLTNVDSHLAVLLCIFRMGEKLVPSGYLLKRSADSLLQVFPIAKKMDPGRTSVLVDSVVAQVIRYVRADGFNKLNNLPRYVLTEGDGYWKPTPPVFMAPIEPHWNKVRTFFLDSAPQFRTAPPATYDPEKGSAFYQMLNEVYQYGKTATAEERDIANFWDCNPFAVQQIGHIEFGLKKISPGGHWIGIAGIACRQRKLGMLQTARVHALVGITLADAFIACWDEKYRSNRVRPETAIQKLIDPAWKPLLQTPPFPEYVSGHSVASNAAAEVLTEIFGDQLTFIDDTEVEFGLPTRTFSSFRKAAAEASVSRLYGGIHYRDAIDQGVWQGKQVGQYMIRKMAALFVQAREQTGKAQP